ncbi:MAG: hypothetical protein GX542_13325 [Rhodococcus sp.]|nr:hypothetical protein [Rhodococcus sp. (in: high G+C Gram-positive bacteria)]
MTEYDERAMNANGSFETWSHAAIKAAVDAMNSSTVSDTTTSWGDLSEQMTTALSKFGTNVIGPISRGGGWEGSAADAAVALFDRYSIEATNGALAIQDTGQALTSAGRAIDELKVKIQGPVQPESGWVAWLRGRPDEEDRITAEREARETMEKHYRPNYNATDGRVPRIPELPLIPGVDEVDDSATSPRGTRSNVGNGSFGGGGSAPGASEPSDLGEAPGPGTGENSAGGQQAESGPQPGPSSTGVGGPASTSAASAGGMAPFAGSGMPAGGVTGPGGVGSGGMGAGASGFGGSAGGGAFGAGPGVGPGAGQPGGPGAGGRGPLGAGGAAGMGRGGMPMGGMMGGAGAGRGGGGDDKEHKVPAYLVTNKHGEELIGKLPPAVPPVLGV